METFLCMNISFVQGLTVNPGNSYTFKECHPQKAHTAGCIVIKQLENVHATLQRKTQTCLILHTCTATSAQLKAHTT